MRQILQVARTEVIEQRRQPSMLVILSCNYLLWGGLGLFVIAVLAQASQMPEVMEMLAGQASTLGLCDETSALQAMLRLSMSSFGAVLFTNLPLFVAIMSGYSVLHDRDVGALPFLMLAPLSRYQLLLGKLLGAMALPVLLHLLFVGTIVFLMSRFESTASFSAQLGGSGAWWIAYLLGAPASAFFIGSLGTVISGLSRDVRTSMQFTSFFVGLLSLAFGYVLHDGILWGLGAQLGFVAITIAMGVFTLGAGSLIIRRYITG